MARLKVTELEIPGVKLIEPIYFEDYRGYYTESYSKRSMAEAGIDTVFVQDNHFYSAKKGTVRGIHFQNEPHAQAKLVRCTRGRMLDIAVDLRKGSPTYKQYVSVELSAENRRQIYIPKGFGHCAVSLTDGVEGQYKVDELYYPEYDRAVRWDDPEIGIDYGTDQFVVSEKDLKSPYLRDSDANFVWEGRRMKTAAVTGAGGFIGGALTRRLLREGITVYGIDISEKALAPYEGERGFRPVIADFSKYGRLHEMIQDDIDVFYHFAWQGVFGDAFQDYGLQLDNAKHACEAVDQAIRMGCKKFVFAGTYNEYEIKNFLNSESFEPRYTCIYSGAKTVAEVICKTLAHCRGIEYSAGLVAMTYGEGNRSMMLPNVVMRQLLAGQTPKLIKGDNLYDLIYIDDIAEAFYRIGEKGKDLKSYYVGHRKLKTFRELLTELGQIVNPDIELRFGEYKDPDTKDYSMIDLDALYNDTGFECRADFKESIKKTAEYIKRELNAEKSVRGGVIRRPDKTAALRIAPARLTA